MKKLSILLLFLFLFAGVAARFKYERRRENTSPVGESRAPVNPFGLDEYFVNAPALRSIAQAEDVAPHSAVESTSSPAPALLDGDQKSSDASKANAQGMPSTPAALVAPSAKIAPSAATDLPAPPSNANNEVAVPAIAPTVGTLDPSENKEQALNATVANSSAAAIDTSAADARAREWIAEEAASSAAAEEAANDGIITIAEAQRRQEKLALAERQAELRKPTIPEVTFSLSTSDDDEKSVATVTTVDPNMTPILNGYLSTLASAVTDPELSLITENSHLLRHQHPPTPDFLREMHGHYATHLPYKIFRKNDLAVALFQANNPWRLYLHKVKDRWLVDEAKSWTYSRIYNLSPMFVRKGADPIAFPAVVDAKHFAKFERAIASEPNNAQRYFDLAEALYSDCYCLQPAKKYFAEGLRIDPLRADARWRLIEVALSDFDSDALVEQIKVLHRQNPAEKLVEHYYQEFKSRFNFQDEVANLPVLDKPGASR